MTIHTSLADHGWGSIFHVSIRKNLGMVVAFSFSFVWRGGGGLTL